MKSSIQELKNRGYVEDEDVEEYYNNLISKNSTRSCKHELISLLNNEQPYRRTIGAKLLKNYPHQEITQLLCEVLKKEKKLYTKIALTETLASFGNISLPFLIPLLGKIGINQYRTVPEKKFKKKNYPLPRDIIARTIIKIGETSLPFLEVITLNGERKQALEAIDAIGFISYYSSNIKSLPILWQVLEKYPKDDLLMWKVVRAFESFPNVEVISFLRNILKQNVLDGIKNEAQRSLTQINYILVKKKIIFET